MTKNNQHVVPHNWAWAIIWEWNSRYTRINIETQAEAIQIAKPIAQNQESELFIHRPNGQIRDRESYWNDPYPPLG